MFGDLLGWPQMNPAAATVKKKGYSFSGYVRRPEWRSSEYLKKRLLRGIEKLAGPIGERRKFWINVPLS
jgi:hypothetical protein